MLTMAKTSLKGLREQLRPKVSQEELARAGDITLATYRNAEQGRNVSYTTATAILHALNAARASRNLPPVNLDDLGLSIV